MKEKRLFENRLENLWKEGPQGIFVYRVEVPEGQAIDWQELPSPSKTLMCHVLTPLENLGPLLPFSTWISEAYSQLDSKQKSVFWDYVKAYFLHEPHLRGWLDGPFCPRLDDLLRTHEEFIFERGLLWDSLWRMLAFLYPATSTVLILEGLDQGGEDLKEFLNRSFWLDEDLPLILGIFTGSVNTLHSPRLHGQIDFFANLEQHKRITHILYSAPLKPSSSSSDSNIHTRLEWNFPLRRLLMAIHSPLPEIPPALSHADRASLLLEKASIEILSENYNEALVSLQAHLGQGHRHGSDAGLGNLLLALVHLRKRDIAEAERYLARGLRLMPRTLSFDQDAFTRVLRIQTHESFWEDPATREINFDLIEPLFNHDKTPWPWIIRSMLSYYRAVMMKYDLTASKELAQKNLKAMELQGNLFQVSKVLHMLGYLHQMDQPSKALEFFEQGILLRLRLGSVDGLIKAYNGVGYFCFSQGDHAKSLEFFQKALELLEKTEDFVEISLTLFNVALSYFLGGYFAATLEILQRILEVMDNLRIESLPWHSRTKLYSLAGCSAFYLGWHSLSLDFWDRSQKAGFPPDSLPSYQLLRSHIMDLLEENQDPENDLQLAYEESTRQMQSIFSGHILMERMLLARKQGKKALEESWKIKAEDTIPTLKLSAQRRLFECIKKGGSLETYEPPETLSASIRSISINFLTLAKREASSFALSRSLGEMNFLKTFQEKIHRDRVDEVNLRLTRELLKKEYPIEGVCHMEEESNQFRLCWASSTKLGVLCQDLGKSSGMKHQTKGLRQWSVGERSFLSFGFKSAAVRNSWLVLALAANSDSLSQDDQNLLTMALSHLDVTLGLSRAHRELTQRITIDQLTGAHTRAECLRLVELERNRCLRYQKKGESRVFTLLYLDLDNFKTVNDTFGHHDGDKILQIFVNSIKACIRDLDLLGRLGGDEFLILLPETNLEGARVVGQRILSYIERNRPFDQVVKSRRGIVIPSEKHPGCSLGGACFHASSQELVSKVIERADQALYCAKKAGKGQLHLDTSFE